MGRLWNNTPDEPEPVIGAAPGAAGGTDWLESEALDRLEAVIGHWRAADDAHGGALFRNAVVAQLRAVSHDLAD
ncbi:hypothetical protein [Umezawaea sp. Da 62-37]|uniref:hypothetical protein n=1 Tax=Umezawaea sp. Da 62-37 TaxID=3075927 RepID=UPI0028F74C21|nr:hypothetical protein [Umezawaea sp. Da 62-37]WNV84909.1 hypothetical protein RM788_43240 [Umezawaea sp. Da 62-37]